ncbi:unnamed protein product [Paramecium pentaurelia]|uniref:non-specific serine/threonine protein kinase n=1 Tax=Paramecium pentaurelia TaxID=43138 RepID=A0A8S1TAW6_9CILI|nr:unnamed protein product [Paramecium pentaurelia]
MGNKQTENQYNKEHNEKMLDCLIIENRNQIEVLIRKAGRVSKEYSFLTPPIGKGKYSEIRKIINKKTGIMRAVKIIQKNVSNKVEGKIINEINTLEMLDHPNIVRVNEYFSDDRFHYIITEYYSGGELIDHIDKQRVFSEAQAAKIIYVLLYTINYCHKKQICHREIKLENILFDRNSEDSLPILIDFGSCSKMDHKMTSQPNHPFFQAPELILGNYHSGVDIWAIGVILFLLLCGYPPFRGKTDELIIKSVIQQEVEFDDPEWDNTSEEAKNLIVKLLQKDPNRRMTAEMALNDIWILKNYELKVFDGLIKRVVTNLATFQASSRLQEATLKLMVQFLATREELSELRVVFMHIDTKLDGVLDQDELQAVMLKYYDQSFVHQQINKICQHPLTYSTFLTRSVDRQTMLQKSKIETAFKLIDRNGSGNISVEELQDTFKVCNAETENPWQEIMTEVDSNQDGSLSLLEFNQMMRQLLIQ